MNKQQLLLRWSKKHKKKLTFHTSILAVILGVILSSSHLWVSAQDIPDVKKDEEAIFTASMVGDLMFSRHIEEVIQKKGYDFLFQYADPYFQMSDFVTGNFKHPIQIPGQEQPPNTNQVDTFSTSPRTIDELTKRNFKSVSIANNRIYDYGYLGFRSTVNFFDQRDDIDAAGVMNDLDDTDCAVIYEHEGLTVATLGVSDILEANSAATTFRPGIMPLTKPEIVMKAILTAAEKADMVLVHVHWGESFDSYINQRQRELAHAMSLAGADVIIGHYPHVVAPVEVYNDTIIFYSLGNFIFDQGWSRTKQSVLAHYRLYEGGEAKMELVPFMLSEGQPKPTKTPSISQKTWKRMLTKNLDPSQWYEEEGHVIIPLNHTRVTKAKGG